MFHRGRYCTAVGERVADQAQRCRRWIDVRSPRDVFLEHVVLDRAGQRGRVGALLLGDQLVEQQQHRRRRVDRHRGGHLAERDLVEQDPHVLERVDRHPDLADLAGHSRRVGVVAHLGRQVERHRESGRAVRDQLAIARVGLRGGAETGVLPHGPGPLGVHRGVRAAGERKLPRLAERRRRVEPGQIGRRVDVAERAPRLGQTRHSATRPPFPETVELRHRHADGGCRWSTVSHGGELLLSRRCATAARRGRRSPR